MSNLHFSPRPNRAHEIAWREWDARAFAEARALDKPILLGISAVWCHWCHVMDETSYSDDEVIRLINERYIPIRVDNDQRPDVNRRYNLGGWPTTAFLTPTGELLTGGTYIPPAQMRAYLVQVSEAYQHAQPDLHARIAAINAQRAQAREARPVPHASLSPHLVDTVLDAVRDHFDPVHGGLGDAPKFPNTDALELALEQSVARRDDTLRAIVTFTLTKMANGGTYDQQAGGFFRYSTTRDWSVPHFEKMLEDNARLLALLARTHRLAPHESFAATMRTLTAYLDATLTDHARGGFFGSQDADEQYYARSRAARAPRAAPFVDRTFYTDWNALMASAYFETGDDARRTFALQTLERVWREMYRADVGLFHYCRADDAPQLPNQLADLAHTTRAFLDAYQATGDDLHWQRARTLAERARAELYDADAGAFWSEPRAPAALGLLREPDKSLNENAAMADALLILYHLDGSDAYRDTAARALEYFAADYARYGFMAAGYARAASHLLNAPVIVRIVGARAAPGTRALHAAARAACAPTKIVQLLDPARHAARLAQLGYPTNTAPCAYVCVGESCLAPVSAPAELSAQLAQVL